MVALVLGWKAVIVPKPHPLGLLEGQADVGGRVATTGWIGEDDSQGLSVADNSWQVGEAGIGVCTKAEGVKVDLERYGVLLLFRNQ